jgi:type II secretion system protein N
MHQLLQKKWVRVLGYVLFSGASLLVFFYFTFPAQAVGQRLSQEIQKTTNGSVNVLFTDVSLYRFSGIAAEKVKIRINSESGPPLELDVDGMHVRLRLLPLLWLSLSVNAGVDLGEGTIDGVISKGDETVDLDLEADDVDFMTPPILTKLAGVPIRGKLAGKVKAKVGFGTGKGKAAEGARRGFLPEQSDGQASITIRAAGFGPGTVSGFTVPESLDFGQLDMAFDLKRGRLRIASFQQKGGQVALDASASSNLRGALSSSTLDACVKFKVTDEAYLAKNPKINTALQLATVQLKKDPEGFLHLKVAGSIGNARRQSGLCRGAGKP